MEFTFAKEIIYDVEWQKLRVSLLDQYNQTGGFTTVDSTKINDAILQEYLEGGETEVEGAFRTFRVLNLWAAVMLGTCNNNRPVMNHIKRNHEKLSVRYRESGWKEIIGGTFNNEQLSWDWDKVKRDLETLYKEEENWFNNIRVNLFTRVATAQRKERLKIGGMQFRKELEYFLSLMEEVSPTI